jgi:MFS family permease
MQFFLAGERVLLTLWVGGLWAIGYIAAPTLFIMQDDRQLAGSLAGQMFHIISYIGLIAGALLSASLLKRAGLHWRVWVLIVMLVLVAIGEYILQPMMESLKLQGLVEGSAQMKQFGMLHGIASILYLIESLSGLVLVIFGLGQRKDAMARDTQPL